MDDLGVTGVIRERQDIYLRRSEYGFDIISGTTIGRVSINQLKRYIEENR